MCYILFLFLDWIDDEFIPDPKQPKPDGFFFFFFLFFSSLFPDWDQPMVIKDPKAKKPKDWDDATQGEWEAPEIPNPNYKGMRIYRGRYIYMHLCIFLHSLCIFINT